VTLLLALSLQFLRNESFLWQQAASIQHFFGGLADVKVGGKIDFAFSNH